MRREEDHTRTPRQAWAVLAALVVLHTAGNLLWVRLDDHPILIDEDRHMVHARSLYTDLRGMPEDTRTTWERVVDLAFREGEFPPLTYFYGAGAIALLGPHPDVLAFSTTPLLALLILGMFLLARGFLPPWEALFATFVASLVPLVYAFSHYFSVDYPAAVAVVWVVVGLLRADGFRRWGWTFLAGLGVALCLLTRPPTLLCALPALCIALAHFARRVRTAESRRWLLPVPVMLFVVVALVPALPWYVVNRSYFYDLWMVHHDAGGAVLHFPSSTANFGIYPFLLINLAMFLPLFLLFLAGTVALVASPRLRSPAAWAVALWPWPMYLILTIFFQQKEVRYAFPMLPAMGLAAAVALLALPWPRARRVACAVGAFVLTAQYVTFTTGWSGPVVHDKYANVVMLQLPWLTFTAHEDRDVYYMGPDGLSIYRNAMLSDSYSYCPPYRGEHFLERLLDALVTDINKNAADRDEVGLGLIARYDQIPGLSNLEFYNALPGDYGRDQWGGGEISKVYIQVVGIVDATVGEVLSPPLPQVQDADYIIFKFDTDETGLAWRKYLKAYGWRVVTHFWGDGYGQCRPGVYMLMTRIPLAENVRRIRGRMLHGQPGVGAE